METLRRSGQHFIHCFIAQHEAGFTNRTDVASTRVFHSMFKLQSVTLSPNSNKPITEPVDIPLLRQQVNYITIKISYLYSIIKTILVFFFSDTWCRYFINYSFL